LANPAQEAAEMVRWAYLHADALFAGRRGVGGNRIE